MTTDSSDSPDLFEISHQFLWNRSCVWKNEFSWVCVMYMRLGQSKISSPHAPTAHYSIVNCARHQNYRAIATWCRPYPYQYGLHRPRFRRSRRPCRTCGGANTPKLGSTSGSSGTSLRVFRYLCKAATYSLAFRSSAMDSLCRVSDSCRHRSVFATATVGLCNRLYSLSNSSTRTNFFAACIISEVD